MFSLLYDYLQMIKVTDSKLCNIESTASRNEGHTFLRSQVNGRDASHGFGVGLSSMLQETRRQFDLIFLGGNVQRSVAVLQET